MSGREGSARRLADIKAFQEIPDSLPPDPAGRGQSADEFPSERLTDLFVRHELLKDGFRGAGRWKSSAEFDFDGMLGDSHEIEVLRGITARNDRVQRVPRNRPVPTPIVEEGPEQGKRRFEKPCGVPRPRNSRLC